MSSNMVNGSIIRFKNIYRTYKCNFRKKAKVKISKSNNNPDKLFFRCVDDKYRFFKWWRPDDDEFMSNDSILDNVV